MDSSSSDTMDSSSSDTTMVKGKGKATDTMDSSSSSSDTTMVKGKGKATEPSIFRRLINYQVKHTTDPDGFSSTRYDHSNLFNDSSYSSKTEPSSSSTSSRRLIKD